MRWWNMYKHTYIYVYANMHWIKYLSINSANNYINTFIVVHIHAYTHRQTTNNTNLSVHRMYTISIYVYNSIYVGTYIHNPFVNPLFSIVSKARSPTTYDTKQSMYTQLDIIITIYYWLRGCMYAYEINQFLESNRAIR